MSAFDAMVIAAMCVAIFVAVLWFYFKCDRYQ